MQPRACGQRISVVGTTGSGKTTIAQTISERLQIPHIELDALFWDANWTGVADEVFRERVMAATAGEQWVIDGNYSRVRALVWGRADTVVYLDYAFWRTFWQLLRRTIQRSLRREVLWSGNRENFRLSFFSRDSVLWWMVQSYHRRRRKYAKLFQQPEYTHLRVVHLRTPRMTRAWLASVGENLTAQR